MPPSFGADLWDNIPAIESLTQDGIDTLNKLGDYLKRRVAIEAEYSKSLQRLDDQFRDICAPRKKNKSNKGETTSFQKGWLQIIQVSETIAKAHANLTLLADGELQSEIKNTVKQADTDRKKFINDVKMMKNDLKKHFDAVEKVKKVYEAACRTAEESRVAFERADKDLNVTKAQVEKFNSDAIQKAKKAEEAADEYEKVLTAANDRQTLHYSEELPTAVNAMQAMEEARIEFIKGVLVSVNECSLKSLPELTASYENAIKAAKSINANEDSLSFIEQNKTGALVPEPLIFENFYEKMGTTSKIKKRENPNSSKTEENFESMPPEKAAKLVGTKLKDVDRDLAELEKKHAGIRTLAEAYLSQPQFADSRTLGEVNTQLDEIEEKLDVLRLRKYKYELFLAGHKGTEVPAMPQLFSDARSAVAGAKLRQTVLGAAAAGGSVTLSNPSLSINPQFDDDNGPPSVQPPSAPATPTLPPPPDTLPGGLIRYRALYEFNGDVENEELPFKTGEILTILEEDNSGWWLAKNELGKQGYVPHNYIEPFK